MTAVSPSPQQITATLRTHRDHTINMIIKQQHNQHTLHNAPLPHHSITAHSPHNNSAPPLAPPPSQDPPRSRAVDEQRAAERGRLAEERTRRERHKASVERHSREQTAAHILSLDKQHRQQQRRQQHSRDSQLPSHLRPDGGGSGVSVEEWRRRVREEREKIEAEEGQMTERMKQMKERIVQLQAEEQAEERKQQHDRQRRQEAEAGQREADEKRRDDRRRWAAALTSAPSQYVTGESRASLSTDSSSGSDSDSPSEVAAVRREEETALEMTRLWDDFKHRWTPQKQQPAHAAPHAPTSSTSATQKADAEAESGLHSLTASTDASLRELTVMLNDMIREFNITAAAVGEDNKPLVLQTASGDEHSATASAVDERHTRDMDETKAAASIASLTVATAAVSVTARKPSPLSSPASSPTRLNTAQRQRSVERGEAQEAEWQLILHELKHDGRDNSQHTANTRDERGGGAAGRVGLFVPSILHKQQHTTSTSDQQQRQSQRAEEERKEGSTEEKKRTQQVRSTAHVDDGHGDDGADGVLYSGLIDFDVNDPHEIDRQRRIEAQLAADRTAQQQQRKERARQAEEDKEEEKKKSELAVSSERVRDDINRYKRSGLPTESWLDETAAAGLAGQASEPRSKPPMLDSTVDVRRWLERLERKIDALANQQQQPSVTQQRDSAQRGIKRKTAAAQPAADVFAPVNQPPQPQRLDDDDRKEPHKPPTAPAAEPTPQADSGWPAARAPRDIRHIDDDGKYATDDEQPDMSPPAASRPTVSQQVSAALSQPPHIPANQSDSSHSQQRPSAVSGVSGGIVVGGGGGLTLQECFARRLGHLIASDEQRRQARQQRHEEAHKHCAANDDYGTAPHHHAPSTHSHSRATGHKLQAAGSELLGRSVRQTRHAASSAQPPAMWHPLSAGRSSSSSSLTSHSRPQQHLGVRGVISVREARARSARVWRHLPEVRRRREEQRKREERRRSVERRQSYDRQRRAAQQSHHHER